MKAALKIGITLTEYNDMTPHELNLCLWADADRKAEEGRERLTMAYMAAYWQRVKRMPSLKEVLKKTDGKQKKQSDKDMLAVVKRLNAAFNGEVKTG